MSGWIRHRGTLEVPREEGSADQSNHWTLNEDEAPRWLPEVRDESSPEEPLPALGSAGKAPVRMLVVVGMLGAAGVALIVACLLLVISFVTSSPQTSAPPSSSASGAPSNAASLARGVDPALVDVNTVMASEGLYGSGTGMVLSRNGLVLTNNHVIEQESSVTVTDVGNGKTYQATVLGYDPSQDIAVLKLTNATGLNTVRLGNSSKIAVRTPVVAVGNAQGKGGTPSYTGGSITAIGQSITASDEINGPEALTGLIEANTRIVPGYSGGPLLNGAGEVVGIVTAGSEGVEFEGVADTTYAIPINEAMRVARQIEAGRASATVHVGPTAFLGVEVESASSGSGALIVGVISGDPAAKAGLSAGDTITAIDNRVVTSAQSLTTLLLQERPGASVRLQYLDPSGQVHTMTLHPGSGPPQ
jgi:S1-C subfamily serine protease